MNNLGHHTKIFGDRSMVFEIRLYETGEIKHTCDSWLKINSFLGRKMASPCILNGKKKNGQRRHIKSRNGIKYYIDAKVKSETITTQTYKK